MSPITFFLKSHSISGKKRYQTCLSSRRCRPMSSPSPSPSPSPSCSPFQSPSLLSLSLSLFLSVATIVEQCIKHAQIIITLQKFQERKMLEFEEPRIDVEKMISTFNNLICVTHALKRFTSVSTIDNCVCKQID